MAKAMRKVRTGSVVRTGADKTAVVEMVWKQRNRLYRKRVRRVARFHVHDPLNQCQLGDTVRIQEVRPISKTKRWRLLEVLGRRQVAEVLPIELEADAGIVVATEEATGLDSDDDANGLAEPEEFDSEESPLNDLDDSEVEESAVDEMAEEAATDNVDPSTDQDGGDSVTEDEDSKT